VSMIPYEGWRYGPEYAVNVAGGQYTDVYL
jgi:hypothetical protein